MKNLTSMTCCVCEKNFVKGDDVVVCPECGAPYHRECYAKNGACVFADKHAEGFEYKPKPEKAEQDTASRCSNCGAENSANNLFCEHCGAPMRKQDDETPKFNGYENQDPNMQTQNNNQGNITFTRMPTNGSFDIYIKETVLEKEFDGISTSDWIKFIGPSAAQYLYQFKRMDDKKNKYKITFCWSALLFSTFFFAYRKMWNWALLSAIGNIIISIPTFIALFAYLGMPFATSVADSTLSTMSFICMLLSWAISIFFSLFSFYLYRQHAVKKIQKIKEKNLPEFEYSHELIRAGAPTFVGVGLIIAVLFVASYAFTFWVGPENIYALYGLY